MSRHEANVLYRSCFLPALTYSFPATWMPQKFLEHIHKLSTSMILNKMGLHSHLPQSMVFAPRNLGGVGLCNLIYEQGTQQLIILIRHLRAQMPFGTAIEGLIRTYQIWAGLPQHFCQIHSSARGFPTTGSPTFEQQCTNIRSRSAINHGRIHPFDNLTNSL